ncbi:flagellar basal body rod protein FlgB [Rubrivivax gelatinosus]|uniref:Flagellar basal body rod protein FlgB n=1 Tax=Rubrivivax gelatinosus (strain NBRC 100245 / IL144) TaxID=983917 RepID=I0HQN3_RUBGI|nr:flagellar basal body rod protein FlgB [Rubrivivax gelatinosus]MBG6081855.1 flagellar basal-body rod protein FlgB [Rubrivivax gelatinosus]BAL95320.1 lateral flagellar rod protein LfgB [Rubrivivax gelatinosus IL144]
MAIDFTKALGVHPQALALRARRTEVLASNIANESTPGFQARDLDFAQALSQAADEAGDGPALDTDDALKYRVPYHARLDGGTVELGAEQAAFSQNVSDFQTSLTFVNMKLRGLAKAIEGQS